MNIIKKFTYVLMATVALFATASCSDPDAEITSIELDRALRPTDVTVKVVDKVNARVSAYFVTTPEVITYTFKDKNGTGGDKEFVAQVPDDKVGKTHQTITASFKLASETQYELSLTSEYHGKGSLPVVTEFETDPEQILNEVTDDDITSTTVRLSWAAGEEVTKVTVEKSGEILQTINLTPAQIAAGECIVTGLKKESKYTFYIWNGDKQRGKMVATTMADYIPVYAGNDVDIQSVIDAAEAGQTIMLMPAKDGSTSEFTFKNDAGEVSTKEITITKNITITCLNTKPVAAYIKFTLAGANGFTTSNIKYVGKSSDIFIKVSNASGVITTEAIEAIGYKNFLNDPGENDCTVDELKVQNCYFHDFSGGRFIDFQKKKVGIKVVNFKQNTIANSCASQDLFRFDFAAGKMPTVNFEYNTIYKVNATSKGLMYIRSNAAGDKAFTANIRNNVFAECAEGTFFSQDKKTDGLDFGGNYYFNSPSLLVAKGEGCPFDGSPKATDIDPKFKAAGDGDFTITNLDVDGGNTEFAKFWGK